MEKKKKKRKPLRYFFYDDFLYKKIHIQRAADIITAFRYSDGKLCQMVYSDVLKNGKRAYTTREVSRFVNRGHLTIENAIKDGNIRRPQFTYGIDENRNFFQYLWREQDIYELHDYLSSIHVGRPRKDGRITTGRGLPTRNELRAMLRTGMVLGYQDENGNFVPTWEAENL